MKIEKVNDNQIRCTLTKEDLADRQLKLSELAYGTEKAKGLFRDMMQQAAYEFGFEAEDIPLMIEAIPLSADTIILIITKVEYPEEIDTRFSKFSASEDEEEKIFPFADDDITDSSSQEIADEILGRYRELYEMKKRMDAEKKQAANFVPLEETVSPKKDETKGENASGKQKNGTQLVPDLVKIYSFRDLSHLIRLANMIHNFYQESNDLYKDPDSKDYLLILRKGKHTPEDFNKVCNILSEYGKQEHYTSAIEAYYQEHLDCMIAGEAIAVLSQA